MSVREEDRQNKNCPSRGLGLAAAAIGVGVGAALYYFFSKRPENPHEEGSTSTWECEQAEAFTEDEFEDAVQDNHSNDSYITLSEHSTTDTSIHPSPLRNNGDCTEYDSSQYISDDENSQCIYVDDNISSHHINGNESESNNSLMSVDMDFESASVMSSDTEIYSVSSEFESEEMSSSNDNSEDTDDSVYSDTDINNDWDVTNSLLDVPWVEDNYRNFNIIDVMQTLISPRNQRNGRARLTEEEQIARAQALSEEEQLKFLRDQAFRERSWSLEECSICFEVILKNQEVMSLPCTHHFHTACILPWLQEQQTCPNCRKAAE